MQQTIEDDFCSKCNNRLQEELIPDRGLCWRLSCSQCSFEKFKTCCPKCQRTFQIKNPLYTIDGLPVECPFSDCSTYFQIVKCPVPQCSQLNFFLNRNYHMGQAIKCKKCETQFQQVVCPHCFVSNYWKGDSESFYKMGQMIKCYSCTKTFKHLACPNCKELEYFPDSNYSYGSDQTCKRCDFKFHQVLCQSCCHSNIYLDKFKYGKSMKCLKESCNQEFKLVTCPTCNKANFLDKKSVNTPDFIAKHDCKSCNSKYINLPCNSCDIDFAISEDSLKTGVNNLSCPTCKGTKGKDQKYYRCQECKEISVNSDVCKKCPPPKVVVPEKDISDAKLCCICLDKPAEVAFIPCGHKKTCRGCSDQIMKQRIRHCPCCRQNITSVLKIFE